MARTYRTLSLSLPPEAVARLDVRGKAEGKTAARVAAEVVLRDVSMFDEAINLPLDGQGDNSMLLHQCIVHERSARGIVTRQHQTISLVDISRIRGGRVDVVEVFLDGEWMEIEGKFDEFKVIWERAKATTASIS